MRDKDRGRVGVRGVAGDGAGDLTTPHAIEAAAECCACPPGRAVVACAPGASIQSRLHSVASASLPTRAQWRAGLITSNNSNSSSSPDLKADIFPTVWNCISWRSENRQQACGSLLHCSQLLTTEFPHKAPWSFTGNPRACSRW